MMMTAANSITWAAIEAGTVYHAWDPSFTVGFATSPNMSRGTGRLQLS